MLGLRFHPNRLPTNACYLGPVASQLPTTTADRKLALIGSPVDMILYDSVTICGFVVHLPKCSHQKLQKCTCDHTHGHATHDVFPRAPRGVTVPTLGGHGFRFYCRRSYWESFTAMSRKCSHYEPVSTVKQPSVIHGLSINQPLIIHDYPLVTHAVINQKVTTNQPSIDQLIIAFKLRSAVHGSASLARPSAKVASAGPRGHGIGR